LDAGVLPLFNPIIEKNSFMIDLQTLAVNNALTLDALFNDKESALNSKSGNYNAINSERLDIGVKYDSFGYIGYTYRNSVFIDMSNESMNFLYKVKYKKELDENRRYNLDANADEFETHGITYSNYFTPYKSKTSSLRLGFALSAVVARNGQAVDITGYATSLGEKDYDFQADVAYAYNENLLYDYDVDSYTGYGYNINLSLLWESEHYSVKFIVNDLCSRIYWDKLAYSTMTASSDNKEYDENGYPIYQPAIRGKEGYSDYIQELTPLYEAEVSYSVDEENHIYLGSDYYHDIFLPYLNLKHNFTPLFSMTAGYETFFGMFNIGLNYHGFEIELKSDSLSDPLSASIRLSGSYAF
jgi:hypothetical protein